MQPVCSKLKEMSNPFDKLADNIFKQPEVLRFQFNRETATVETITKFIQVMILQFHEGKIPPDVQKLIDEEILLPL